ncbi:Abortive infection protein [Syntrophobotulus glycolicus DSM 8271]|uniref:Abortive infection protein n=1 Tax=Syntrophobotulus glycolicus (strain DSM 8271 / FlGlyR) TaxID=645991 RepID=F0T039_SYNGF|nr:CPBP family intramembrane glutamic endopeptidase [Syntrophobotulus glycolicus]ADY56126.1 Abortive infection protein [Syntrophobotulus glycolicus DSM 8271]
MRGINRNGLLLNLLLSNVILLIVGLLLLKYLALPKLNFVLFSSQGVLSAILQTAGFTFLLLTVVLIFTVLIPQEKLNDEINERLFESLSYPELAAVFLFGAIVEELLFRVVLQSYTGPVLSSVLFALAHYRYLTKPYILIQVLMIGLVLGCAYWLTGVFWVVVAIHFCLNLSMAVLEKTGTINKISKKSYGDEA